MQTSFFSTTSNKDFIRPKDLSAIPAKGPNVFVDDETFNAYRKRFYEYDRSTAFACFLEICDLSIKLDRPQVVERATVNMYKLRGITPPPPTSQSLRHTSRENNKKWKEDVDHFEEDDIYQTLPNPDTLIDSVHLGNVDNLDNLDNFEDSDTLLDSPSKPLAPPDTFEKMLMPNTYADLTLDTAFACFEENRQKCMLLHQPETARRIMIYLCGLRDFYTGAPLLKSKALREARRFKDSKEKKTVSPQRSRATTSKKFPVPKHFSENHPHRAPSRYEGDGIRETIHGDVIFIPEQLNEREKKWLTLKNKILTENTERMLRILDHREHNLLYRDIQHDQLLKDFVWKKDPPPPCREGTAHLTYHEEDWLAPRGETAMTLQPVLPARYRNRNEVNRNRNEVNPSNEEAYPNEIAHLTIPHAAEAEIIAAYAQCLYEVMHYPRIEREFDSHIDRMKKEELREVLQSNKWTGTRMSGVDPPRQDEEEHLYTPKVEIISRVCDSSAFSDLKLALGYEILPEYLRVIPQWAVSRVRRALMQLIERKKQSEPS